MEAYGLQYILNSNIKAQTDCQSPFFMKHIKVTALYSMARSVRPTVYLLFIF